MALQGNLRDFSVTEILQLLGSQKKSGCLILEWNSERAQIFVDDGRIVAARTPGMKTEDPLLQFLLQAHRLSDEQRRGLLSIHKESNRDLEDLLVNGRYLEAEELKAFIERQILNDLMRVVRWDNGTYRFDPKVTWSVPILVRLSMEGALIEAARRVDEHKRFVSRFKNPYDLLGVRDLPDPDEPLSEEEKELFGIIDGQHTVAEIVAAAPLGEYEAYEALDRMLEATWIEVVGRRDPGTDVERPARRSAPRPQMSLPRELMVAGIVLVVAAGTYLGGRTLQARPATAAAPDVFAATRVERLREALELYHLEHGAYPRALQVLVDDDWLGAEDARVPGYAVRYHPQPGARGYELAIDPQRRR